MLSVIIQETSTFMYNAISTDQPMTTLIHGWCKTYLASQLKETGDQFGRGFKYVFLL